MAAIKTLKEYIERSDAVLNEDNNDEAKDLQKEILAAFGVEYEGLSVGLAQPIGISVSGMPSASIKTNYLGNIKILKSRLRAELDKIEETMGDSPEAERKKLLFISHANKDAAYVKELVTLLEYIGLREGDMVCSSAPDYGIPMGYDIYDWLREKFETYDLHVLFVLSHHFYESAASLNEMGAAWVLKQKYDFLLLPGFDFSDIKGAINRNQIGIKLDGDIDEVNKKLGQLKDSIVSEFELREVPEIGWGKRRDAFVREMAVLAEDQKKNDESASGKQTVEVSSDACLLLVYASHDPHGQILRLAHLGGMSVSTAGFEFIGEVSAKETARWTGAVEELERYGLVNATSFKREVFELTREGFEAAEKIEEANPEINVSNDPEEYM